MRIRTKRGDEYIVLRIGRPECEDPCPIVYCYNNTDKDLFGKPAITEINISDIEGFLGSYAFEPIRNL